MSGSPMVIMWSNSDGNVTLSQRTAPYEIEPTLDSNPPRIATLSESLTSVWVLSHCRRSPADKMFFPDLRRRPDFRFHNSGRFLF